VLFTRVLVPVDFSSASLEALRLAVSVGLREGARLTIMTVDTEPWSKDSDAELQALRRWAVAELPSSLHVDFLVERGSPADRINAQAISGEHDLVVMGTHGKTGLERVMLGSVAETVVRTCAVPVMVTHDRSASSVPEGERHEP